MSLEGLRCSGTPQEKSEYQLHVLPGTQIRGHARTAVLGFFCSVEAMPMLKIFQGRGAYQEKKGSEVRILRAGWVSGEGRQLGG